MLDTVDTVDSFATVRHWEKAGTLLANALSMYLDICNSLGTNSLKEGMRPKDLATRIDSTLDSLHTLVEQQISQARSVLSQTRNKILSPAAYLPQEILIEIFTYVVFSYRDPHRGTVVTMEEGVIEMYRSLHSLLGVCSVWRDVVLSQGEFWSTIPLFKSSAHELRCKKATELSLERAGHCNLGLAAVLVPSQYRYLSFDTLREIASRFCTVNIVSRSINTIKEMMEAVYPSSYPNAESESHRLSELSICQIRKAPLDREFPEEYDYIDTDYSDFEQLVIDQYGALSEVLGSLSIFRLCGTQLWS